MTSKFNRVLEAAKIKSAMGSSVTLASLAAKRGKWTVVWVTVWVKQECPYFKKTFCLAGIIDDAPAQSSLPQVDCSFILQSRAHIAMALNSNSYQTNNQPTEDIFFFSEY